MAAHWFPPHVSWLIPLHVTRQRTPLLSVSGMNLASGERRPPGCPPTMYKLFHIPTRLRYTVSTSLWLLLWFHWETKGWWQLALHRVLFCFFFVLFFLKSCTECPRSPEHDTALHFTLCNHFNEQTTLMGLIRAARLYVIRKGRELCECSDPEIRICSAE